MADPGSPASPAQPVPEPPPAPEPTPEPPPTATGSAAPEGAGAGRFWDRHNNLLTLLVAVAGLVVAAFSLDYAKDANALAEQQERAKNADDVTFWAIPADHPENPMDAGALQIQNRSRATLTSVTVLTSQDGELSWTISKGFTTIRSYAAWKVHDIGSCMLFTSENLDPEHEVVAIAYIQDGATWLNVRGHRPIELGDGSYRIDSRVTIARGSMRVTVVVPTPSADTGTPAPPSPDPTVSAAAPVPSGSDLPSPAAPVEGDRWERTDAC
ncbi:hypothetical protein V1634_29050 [Plantactinospora veratri]|uniref:Secreted protein n=1 Tax=Plantactinospora veratri TaxID=1436122 RepID=A0ABU7SLP9_9ACTN